MKDEANVLELVFKGRFGLVAIASMWSLDGIRPEVLQCIWRFTISSRFFCERSEKEKREREKENRVLTDEGEVDVEIFRGTGDLVQHPFQTLSNRGWNTEDEMLLHHHPKREHRRKWWMVKETNRDRDREGGVQRQRQRQKYCPTVYTVYVYVCVCVCVYSLQRERQKRERERGWEISLISQKCPRVSLISSCHVEESTSYCCFVAFVKAFWHYVYEEGVGFGKRMIKRSEYH